MYLIVQLQRQIPISGDIGGADGDTEMPHADPEVELTGGDQVEGEQQAEREPKVGGGDCKRV